MVTLLVRLQDRRLQSLIPGACELSQLQLESQVRAFRCLEPIESYLQCAACIYAQPTGYTAVNGTSLSPVDYMTCESEIIHYAESEDWFVDCAEAGYTFGEISSSLYPASTGRASMTRSAASATPTTRVSFSSQDSGRVRSTASPSQAASSSSDRGTAMPSDLTNGTVVRDAASTRLALLFAILGMLAVGVVC